MARAMRGARQRPPSTNRNLITRSLDHPNSNLQVPTAMPSSTTACRVLIIICLSVGQLSAADLPSAKSLQSLGLETRWRNQATMDIGRDTVAHVTNDENNIYIQSTGGVLTAFDAENGNKLWTAQVGRNDEPAMALTSNDDIVVVVVGPVIYGFNKFTGRSVLKHRLPGQPSASPTMNDSAIFVPITGGAIYAYSLGVLQYKFRYGALPDTSPRSFMWRFICAEEIVTRPVLGKLALAFATQAGNIHSVEISGTQPGKSRFQMLLNEPASAPLAIAPNETSSSVVMLTGDNQAFSLDLLKGSAEWVYPVGRNMTQAPVVVGDHVYVVTTENTLTRITRETAVPLKQGRPVEIPLEMAPNRIGVAIEESALDASLQQKLRLPLPNAVRVVDVAPGSPGQSAGLQVGDLIVRIDGLSSTSVDEARDLLEELPARVERNIAVVRDDQLQRLKIRIPIRKWDVTGVVGITAIGRFNAYGRDQAGRLVAYDLKSAEQIGRLNITAFNVPHQNFVTDQIYLVADNGEIACLREIGPTVRVPDLGPTGRTATVTKVLTEEGEASDPDATAICEIQLPDGTTSTVTSEYGGVVRSVYVKVGDMVTVDTPLALISDDKFASYYRNPANRPVDVDMQGVDGDNSGN